VTAGHDRDVLTFEVAGRRLEFQPVDESPCRRACPAGIDVKKYVGQIASEKFEDALATIRRHMPFPSACGRICLHPCETECKRGEIDQPIAIMALKRFVADYESRKGVEEPLPRIRKTTGKRIAVIGSGPAGLTAAHDLALRGHSVTVFERSETPGGMMTRAIPEFDLPSAAVHRDIARIEKLGVSIECGHSIQGEKGLQSLKEGYDAVLLATGAGARWKGLSGTTWIDGGTLPGVIGAVEFMASRRSSGNPDLGRVVVLGSGVHALACARTAVRLGCAKVKWIIPVTREFLQPDHHRVKLAEEEGVEIIELARPVAIGKTRGKVGGVKIVSIEQGEADHTGRPAYRVKPHSETVIACDSVIDAAHFAPDNGWGNLSSDPWGTISVDLDTMATNLAGIFAAGDVVSGPKSVVEAVSMGHRAAAGIDRYLSGGRGTIGTLSTPIRTPGWEIEDPAGTPSEAFRPAVRPANERKSDFKESELSFTAWEASHEARRCLLCGPCEECAVCLSTCYRKRGVADDEKGNPVEVRVPLGVARGIHEETRIEDFAKVELLVARVDSIRCRGCGVCEDICGYKAPRISPDPKYGLVSTIDILACKGCGTCVSACPSGAIDQGVTSLHALRARIWGGAK